MPPEQGQKRIRIDNEDEGEAIVEIPKIIKDSIWNTVNKYGNLTTNICKKKEAIKKLKQHLIAETVPKSLKWTPKIFVGAKYQGEINFMVDQAIANCHRTILEKLVQIREDELEQLKEARDDLKNKWEEEARLILSQLKEEGIFFGDINEVVQNSRTKLITDLAAKERNVEMAEFSKRKRKEEAFQIIQEKRQQDAINTELKNPEIENLRKDISTLAKEISELKKKGNAKPVTHGTKNTGGGKRKNPNTPKNTPRTQNKTNQGKGKNQGKKQKEKDQGNRKHPSHSKRSTNRSGSKQKQSRQKRN